MSRAFRSLIERQIAKARASGQLDGLEGAGKPLPKRDPTADGVLETGYRIMAENGVLPEEFELRKRLDAARQAYASEPDETKRKTLMSDIAELEMRFNIAADARRRFIR